jgi:hypothetical protein
MMTAGLILVFVLAVSLFVAPLIGMRVDGWGGVIVGASGIVYCFITDPTYILVVVFPLSLGLLVIGGAGLVSRKFRGRKTAR